MSEDPAEEVVSKGMRLALVAAAIGSQKIAEQIKWRAVAHQAASEAEATRARLAYEAARENARGWLEKFRPDENMSVDLVADAYTSARAWAEVEPEAFSVHLERIASEIRTQYGIDPDQVATEATLRGRGDAEKTRGAQSRNDAAIDAVAAGQVLVAGGEELAEHSNVREADSIVSDDRADQLDATAAIVARHEKAGVDPETSRQRIHGAQAQGKPARYATRGGKARPLPRGASRSGGRERDRGR